MNTTAIKEELEEGYESVNNPYGMPLERNAPEIPLLVFHDLAGQTRKKKINQIHGKVSNVEDDDSEDISGSSEYESDESPYDFFSLLKQNYDNVHSSENKPRSVPEPSDGNNLRISESPFQTKEQTPQPSFHFVAETSQPPCQTKEQTPQPSFHFVAETSQPPCQTKEQTPQPSFHFVAETSQPPCQTVVPKPQHKRKSKICINVGLQIDNSSPYVSRQFSLPSANRENVEKKTEERNVNVESIMKTGRQVKKNSLHSTGTSRMYPGTNDVINESVTSANMENDENKTKKKNVNIEPTRKTSNRENVEKKAKERNVDVGSIRKSGRQVKKNSLHSDFLYNTGTSRMFPGTNDVINDSMTSANMEKVEKKTKERNISIEPIRKAVNRENVEKKTKERNFDIEPIRKSGRSVKKNPFHSDFVYSTGTSGMFPGTDDILKESISSANVEKKSKEINVNVEPIRKTANREHFEKETKEKNVNIEPIRKSRRQVKKNPLHSDFICYTGTSGMFPVSNDVIKESIDTGKQSVARSSTKKDIRKRKPDTNDETGNVSKKRKHQKDITKKKTKNTITRENSLQVTPQTRQENLIKGNPFKVKVSRMVGKLGAKLENPLDIEENTRSNSRVKSVLKKPRPKKFVCEYCPETFSLYYKVKAHQLQVHGMTHSTVKPYSCSLCGHSNAVKDKMNLHLKLMHFDITKNANLDSFIEIDNKELKLHHKRNSKEKQFSCSLCELSFSRKYDLRLHLKIMHFDITKNADLHSFIEINNKELKLRHKRNSKEKQFSCRLCNLSFSRKYDLKDHLEMIHFDITENADLDSFIATKNKKLRLSRTRPFVNPYSCSVCLHSFARKDNLELHIKTKHLDITANADLDSFVELNYKEMKLHPPGSKEKPYACSLCNHSSVRKDNLRDHLKKLHFDITKSTDLDLYIKSNKKCSKEKPYSCSLCDYSSDRKDRVKRHLKGIHIDVTKNADLDSFIEIEDDMKLLMACETVKPYLCSLCNHSSTRKDNLRDHLKIVHFDITKNVDLNLFIETNNKELKLHPKKLSKGKAETNNKELKLHHKTHIKEKPYSCNLCDHSSNRKDRLKHHLKGIHFDITKNADLDSFIEIKDKDLKLRMARATVKPYSCSLCDFTCSRTYNLKLHFKRIHFDITRNADLKSLIKTDDNLLKYL